MFNYLNGESFEPIQYIKRLFGIYAFISYVHLIHLSEKLFRNVADIFVEEGYRDAGYEYIVIDDCWLERTRDHALKLQADKKRFPRGIQDLARYVSICNQLSSSVILSFLFFFQISSP